jgi:hypothetical protein
MKFMVAFASPVTALEWCLLVQVRQVLTGGWLDWSGMLGSAYFASVNMLQRGFTNQLQLRSG